MNALYSCVMHGGNRRRNAFCIRPKHNGSEREQMTWNVQMGLQMRCILNTNALRWIINYQIFRGDFDSWLYGQSMTHVCYTLLFVSLSQLHSIRLRVSFWDVRFSINFHGNGLDLPLTSHTHRLLKEATNNIHVQCFDQNRMSQVKPNNNFGGCLHSTQHVFSWIISFASSVKWCYFSIFQTHKYTVTLQLEIQ